MLPTTRSVSKNIGAEILPIVTAGLYRNSLDAIREYIQNAIDAGTPQLEVSIDTSSISVSDSGHGMSTEAARRAMRLGISDKNPSENIGFRGIGIYSGFNLCDCLEIFSKSADDGKGSHIVFDFGKIRRELLVEQERRKEGAPPSLYLERLLNAAVFVEEDKEQVVQGHGTRVVLTKLLPELYRPLQDWETVVTYLQNVVPLPFDPEFRYATQISKRFAEEDYRVVPVTLQIGSRREPIYRPYKDRYFA